MPYVTGHIPMHCIVVYVDVTRSVLLVWVSALAELPDCDIRALRLGRWQQHLPLLSYIRIL
jgi:hypothetical protein